MMGRTTMKRHLPIRETTTAVPERSPGRGVVLGLVLSLLALAAPAAGQFSVQPVIMEMRVADSASVATFAVRNESDEAMQLRIYTADYDQPEDGSHRFMESGTHPRSCADRLQAYPSDLSLEPRQADEVQVRLAPGDSTCWSVIFVQSQARRDGGVRIAQRIGVKVYGLSTAAVREGEIREVTVHGPADARTVEIMFQNTGTGPLRPEGELEVRTEAGDIVAVVPVEPFSVLPGRSRRAEVPLDVSLAPGRYLVIPILDFGADYLAGGQAAFEVSG